MLEKLKSRKFQVWLVWTIITIVALFVGELPKETIFTYYGLVSMIYLGANTAGKFTPTGKVE